MASALRVSIAGQFMGAEITSDQAPTLEVALAALAPIAAVAVVRDNRFIYTAEPKANQAGFTFRDLDLKPGQASYYYLRALVQGDAVVWSSPLWVRRTGNPASSTR